MAKVEDLKKQLEELRKRHTEEVEQEMKAIEKLKKDLEEIGNVEVDIEKEIAELQRASGNGNKCSSPRSGAEQPSILGSIALGLVDANESKCKKR